MSKAEKTVRYVNLKTGEAYEKKSFVDIQFDDEEGYLLWRRKAHVRTFLDMPLPDGFTWSERGRLGELKHYILKDSQFLAYRSGNRAKPFDIGKISKVLGMSSRQGRAFLKKAIAYGVLKTVTDGDSTLIAYNPIYGMRAKRLTIATYMLFRKELEHVLPEWVKRKFAEQADHMGKRDDNAAYAK